MEGHPVADTLQAGAGLRAGDSLTSSNGSYTLELQSDGNLVLASGGAPIWASKTDGSGAVRAELQPDGNLVLFDRDGSPVWESETAGHSDARLTVQDDRNVVIYAGTKAVWSSGSGVTGIHAADDAANAHRQAAPEISGLAPTDPVPASHLSYTVENGDTLESIAERFYGDSSQSERIAQANGIDNRGIISVGEVLTIPT
jgi:LysM repeat protein